MSLPPTMTLQGLPWVCTAVQLHLHWGRQGQAGGSEHRLDGEAAPAEVNGAGAGGQGWDQGWGGGGGKPWEHLLGESSDPHTPSLDSSICCPHKTLLAGTGAVRNPSRMPGYPVRLQPPATAQSHSGSHPSTGSAPQGRKGGWPGACGRRGGCLAPPRVQPHGSTEGRGIPRPCPSSGTVSPRHLGTG